MRGMYAGVGWTSIHIAAQKRCSCRTIAWFVNKHSVGASLLAKAPRQLASMLNVRPQSRAGSLPQEVTAGSCPAGETDQIPILPSVNMILRSVPATAG
ncbi:hypothetical protein EGM97_23015 [Pseudomonas sp. AF32]|nr:hypothetical protein [Pseudomonas sp. AF32]